MGVVRGGRCFAVDFRGLLVKSVGVGEMVRCGPGIRVLPFYWLRHNMLSL